ncbi:hypothetical protein NLJ89_g2449 [Agrocybe chaxingu]|uniref:Peptidase C14 caspase domain-containing protein n=1 Tax=Agrocybe chaxingu TaxID=84603 RepID=A0A9W8MXM7_9AGAR|nr:hypothetical protein NLJ89_g2449 [Agrocybe chaxingu]
MGPTPIHLCDCAPFPRQSAPPRLQAVATQGRRRALIIGICGNSDPKSDGQSSKPGDGRSSQLKGPHNEAKGIGKLLQDVYDYPEENIKYLLDDGGDDKPTEENILNYIDDLVKGARPGDRFFFHYSGHSSQEKTDNPKERDGKDEYIITCDGKRIVDDVLHECLVKPLPEGSSLTAIFDSCHSGTLLDLNHDLCNAVYLPFFNKGVRRTREKWRRVGRQGAMDSGEMTLPAASTMMSQQSIASSHGSGATRKRTISTTRFAISEPDRSSRASSRPLLSITTETQRRSKSLVTFCESPGGIHDCDGFCRDMNLRRPPTVKVISISSSGDDQKTWEDENGTSMTTALIKTLRDVSHPTLAQLLARVSYVNVLSCSGGYPNLLIAPTVITRFELHVAYLTLHSMAVAYRMECRQYHERHADKQGDCKECKSIYATKGAAERINHEVTNERDQGDDNDNNQDPDPKFLPEMINFQIPQLSSHTPLPPDLLWDP